MDKLPHLIINSVLSIFTTFQRFQRALWESLQFLKNQSCRQLKKYRVSFAHICWVYFLRPQFQLHSWYCASFSKADICNRTKFRQPSLCFYFGTSREDNLKVQSIWLVNFKNLCKGKHLFLLAMKITAIKQQFFYMLFTIQASK